MTKFYTLPGLRLGYAVTRVEHARRLREHLVPWSVNALAQAAGVAALSDTEFRQETGRWLPREVNYLALALAEFTPELRHIDPSANFILARLRTITAPDLAVALSARGVFIRDASNFVGLDERYIRLAVRTRAENERLIQALVRVLGAKTGTGPLNSKGPVPVFAPGKE